MISKSRRRRRSREPIRHPHIHPAGSQPPPHLPLVPVSCGLVPSLTTPDVLGRSRLRPLGLQEDHAIHLDRLAGQGGESGRNSSACLIPRRLPPDPHRSPKPIGRRSTRACWRNMIVTPFISPMSSPTSTTMVSRIATLSLCHSVAWSLDRFVASPRRDSVTVSLPCSVAVAPWLHCVVAPLPRLPTCSPASAPLSHR